LSHVIYREFIDLGSFSIVIECVDQCNLHHYPINISKESVILNLWFGDTIFHENRFNHFDREAQMDENAKKLKKMASRGICNAICTRNGSALDPFIQFQRISDQRYLASVW
jgi:hypothetical protein